ncbi:phosphotransferase [Herbaspirillum sp. B65]|uniref:phosphotransferase n=1 Tax=Herbaspirillum sp. B65 TaxID=137708 RepID=UPI0005C8089D|nr:phosphotransferase [Herbaspirillum sp. B65]
MHLEGENALFAVSAPKLSERQAAKLALEAFGIGGTASLLTSERDQNFRLLADNGNAYVLKVTHPSEDPLVTDFQTQAQIRLSSSGSAQPVPRLIGTLEGQPIHWAPVGENGAKQAVRLMTFLPGVPLYKCRAGKEQRRALGKALARFDAALAGFSHPGSEQKLLWDIQHLSDLRSLLPEIDDHGKRVLAERYLDLHEKPTVGRAAGLRRQVIHNDLNAYNVLVDHGKPDIVTAILDFGDMVAAPLINDLAVACAYQLSSTGNPLDSANDCIVAYHAECPLTEAELALLPGLIIARLLVTVLITEWRAKQHPENRAYILRNNPLSWEGLRRFDTLAAGQAEDSILEAIRIKEDEGK